MIDYDPTHVEARLRGALREISPAMRADWREADRKLRRRNIVGSLLGMALGLGVALLLWKVL